MTQARIDATSIKPATHLAGLFVETEDGTPGLVETVAKGWVTVRFEDGTRKHRAKDLYLQPGDEKAATRSMSATLNRYRATYEPSIACGGRKSLNNGDDLASLLAGLEPEQVIKLAELALDLEVGSLQTKYDSLNPGQKRMNAGNRLRAAIKRGDLELDAIRSKASGVVGLDSE
jgi:hypothetical protein